MRQVTMTDVTIRQPAGEGGFALSFREKIELAKQLDRLGVSVIELGGIVSRRTDSLLVKSVASAVRESTLAVALQLDQPDTAEITWNALKGAAHPRLQVTAPVSTVVMEYVCHLKAPAMLEKVRELVKEARALCEDVEFVAEDAGRSEPAFLKEILAAAVEAGAGTVTVCDTAGTLLPQEFGEVIRGIRQELPETVGLGVRCSNELGIAEANAMAALQAGAEEVKTAACGEFTASLEKLVHILHLKGGEMGVACGVRATELKRATQQIRWMCETHRSKASPFDSGVREEAPGVELTQHDGEEAVLKAVEKLGYELSEEDKAKVWEAFTGIAGKKETVTARELDAIVASAALQVPPTYQLEDYIVNAGSGITSTAHVRVRRGDAVLDGLALGDGPIDAGFLAIEQIVGTHYELDDFQIQAVTEGREAMGETVVRLRATGKVYSGRGISTDIIGAAILAYLSAVNKIVYEENGEGE